jgi:hypothetical protein
MVSIYLLGQNDVLGDHSREVPVPRRVRPPFGPGDAPLEKMAICRGPLDRSNPLTSHVLALEPQLWHVLG